MSVTRDQLGSYVSESMDEEQIASLIEKHVDARPNGLGVNRARLRDSGASVAAVIADLEALDGDVAKTAEDFDASISEVIAAVFFYWEHQEVIDAEITVRRSAFMA